jgi:hypothetical protein
LICFCRIARRREQAVLRRMRKRFGVFRELLYHCSGAAVKSVLSLFPRRGKAAGFRRKSTFSYFFIENPAALGICARCQILSGMC